MDESKILYYTNKRDTVNFKCNFCGDGIVTVENGGIVCNECGLSYSSVVDYIISLYGMDNRLAKRLTKRWAYELNPQLPDEFTPLIYNGNTINGIDEEGNLFYPDIPVLLERPIEDSVVTTSIHPLYTNDESINCFISYNSPVSSWAKHKSIKSRTHIYSGQVDKAKAESNGFTVVSLEEYNSKPRKSNERRITKNTRLEDIINEHHFKISDKGIRYEQAPHNCSYATVAREVVEWLKCNGTEFYYDPDNEDTYIKFDDTVYKVDNSNYEFKEFLLNIGGIQTVTQEGRCIVDAIKCTRKGAYEIKPVKWLNCERNGDTTRLEIVQRDGTTIIVSNNEVKVERTGRSIYSSFNQSWFVPFNCYTQEDFDYKKGIRLMWDLCFKHFVVSDIAKEIILSWFITIFLQDLSSVRPGIRISGNAGVGKSVILKLLYWLFYGKSDDKLPRFTLAGAWRRSSYEPWIMIDNENVKEMNEGWQTFFDLAATGGQRVMGESGSATTTVTQTAHIPVLLSGLDTFLLPDVRTRYLEVEAKEIYRTDFYESMDKRTLLVNRDTLLSSIMHFIAKEIIPSLGEVLSRKSVLELRTRLGMKHRIVDYFIMMSFIGGSINSILKSSNEGVTDKWIEFLSANSEALEVKSSSTVAWMVSLKELLKQESMTVKIKSINSSTGERLLMQTTRHPIVRFTTTPAKDSITMTLGQLLDLLRWCAATLHVNLPYKTPQELEKMIHADKDAWSVLKWEYNILENNEIEVKW